MRRETEAGNRSQADRTLQAVCSGRNGLARPSALYGGLVGPVAFIAAWVVGSAVLDGYSFVDDAISRLAEDGASTRPLMTAGFVIFAVAMQAYAVGLWERSMDRGAAMASLTGIATLLVAIFPVGDRWGDLHAAFAVLGYISLAALPLAARPYLPAESPLARAAAPTAALIAASLVAAALGSSTNGLFQRLGLTIGDVWIIASVFVLAAPCRPPGLGRSGQPSG